MTILVDFDNVMVNTGEAWVATLNRRYCTSVDYNDVTEWDITRFFPGIERDDIYAPLSDGSVWESVVPVDGSQEFIQKMIDDGHEVYVATSSSLNTIGKKWKEVLQKFFPMIHHNNVIVASKKQMLKADILIDDAPFNIEGGEYFGILFDAPHNRSYELPAVKPHSAPTIVRASDWNKIYDWVVWCAWELDDYERENDIYG